MNKFVVLSFREEKTHYSRGCRMETDPALFERCSVDTEEEVAEKIAYYVHHWGDYCNQVHWVFYRWDDFVDFAGNCSSYGANWKEHPSSVIVVPYALPDWDDDNQWEAAQANEPVACELHSRLLEAVKTKVGGKKTAEEKAKRDFELADAERRRLANEAAEKATLQKLKEKYGP